jgi:hypothetical protein
MHVNLHAIIATAEIIAGRPEDIDPHARAARSEAIPDEAVTSAIDDCEAPPAETMKRH